MDVETICKQLLLFVCTVLYTLHSAGACMPSSMQNWIQNQFGGKQNGMVLMVTTPPPQRSPLSSAIGMQNPVPNQVSSQHRPGSNGQGGEKCPDVCVKMYEPVCASNGFTYGNTCELKRRTCGQQVAIAHAGICDPPAR